MKNQSFGTLFLIVWAFAAPTLSQAKALIDSRFATDGTTLQISLRSTDFADKQTLASMALQIGDQTYPAKTLKPFTGETATDFYFLVDTSQTMRGDSIKQSIGIIKKALKALPAKAKITIAGFDKSLELITQSDADGNLDIDILEKLKAGGKVTELYRLVLEAEKQMVEPKAAHPVIIVFSDGRVEDTEYSADDVIKFARQHNLVIYSYGFNYSVELQSLRRISEESGGAFFEVKSNGQFDEKSIGQMTVSAINGGTAEFILAGFEKAWGKTYPATIRYQYQGQPSQTEAIDITFPDRSWQQIKFKTIPLLWWAIGGASLLLLSIVIFTALRRAKSRAVVQDNTPTCHACGKEIDTAWSKCAHCGTPLNLETPLAQLVTVDQPQTRNWAITKARTTIGRMNDNDVILDSETVGRWHAVIQLKDDKFFLQDLGSANTVLLNKKAITSALLSTGDTFDIGGIKIRFEIT
ncbi:MAG: FHA domain-containing protein [Methylobacter sp.]